MTFKFNPNPNFKEDAKKAFDEKLRSILNMRCAEHNQTPQPRNEGGKLQLETCCETFENEVKRAMEER